MNEVRLTGQLVCTSDVEQGLVARLLPEHIALTRVEPGCILFEVTQIEDSLIWRVEERFADAASFHAHLARVAASEWGRATHGIAREYVVEGLAEPDSAPLDE